jgi:hypothetical protein
MTTVDLDAAAIARREAKKVGPSVKFKRKTFKLPVELPYDVPEALAEVAAATARKDDNAITVAISLVLRALLTDDYEAFRELKPSMDDVQALIQGVLGEYGFQNPGEAPASQS